MNLKLFKIILSAYIPLTKLNNTKLIYFLEKYVKFDTSDESILNKNYVEKCYFSTK